MFTCPHCDKPSIRLWAKYWATTVEPAVCEDCDKPSSIPSFVESASASLYFIAGLCALGVFAIDVARVRSGTLIDGPTPVTLLIGLLVFFYVAIEAAKVYWVPLKALSDHEVEKKRSTWNRVAIALVIIVSAAVLFEKCGF